MKLSRSAYYALQAVAHLAKQEGEASGTAHAIAAARKIPGRFLPKVLKPLVWAQVLRSVKGPDGGYRLAWPAGRITLLQVVEAVDGPIRGHVALGAGGPGATFRRRLGEVCSRLAEQARKVLGGIKVSDLAAAGGEGDAP
jgi:Rrf2 family protein